MCRSWTERTPSSSQIAAPAASTSNPAGAASISTSTGSLIRRQEESEDQAREIARLTIGSTTRGAAGEDEGAGEDDAKRAERIGGAVPQHPLEVDVLTLAAGQNQRRGDVAEQAEQAEPEHPAGHRSAADRQAGRSPRTAIAIATATSSSPLTSAARISERW